MITGLSNATYDIYQKVVELLVETLPRLQRVGFLVDSNSASIRAATVKLVRGAAEHLRVEAILVDVARPENIEPAFAQLARDKAQAVVVLPSAWIFPHYPKILALALPQRWPVVGTIPAGARQGGLLSFGPDRDAIIRRSAYYVDRILKGAKPGDLPIEQPTAFELVLNLKTAKTLGIAIPQSIRLRATEVIE
jgi:putative ABC transport system substrate-binding protein